MRRPDPLDPIIRKISRERSVEQALAYLRVSPERSAEKNLSPTTWRRSMLRCAEQKRYIIKRWYTDLAS